MGFYLLYLCIIDTIFFFPPPSFQMAGDFLSCLSRLLTAYLQRHSGFSCGVQDLLLLQGAEGKRSAVLSQANSVAEDVARRFMKEEEEEDEEESEEEDDNSKDSIKNGTENQRKDELELKLLREAIGYRVRTQVREEKQGHE